ncbi:protein CBFA2T2 [Galendromus occidentalis]|uniref:Protein CBFA2T2 n=1 Tax=Galendromus occidentalis TaxID=34638 RepID=A0AAJ7SIE0_9ACAR|nr:protein CBFA2T2 [Galendromus occidentalis]
MPDATASEGGEQRASQVPRSPQVTPANNSPSRGRSPSPERASSQRMESNRTSPSSTSDSPPTAADTTLQQRVQKIRRVFTIIRNFCADVSQQSGEAMTKLLCSVVCATVSLEDFRVKVAELTGLHLKAFVIPFLRANLPVMQNQLLVQAKSAKLNTLEFLSNHSEFLVDPAINGEPFEIFEQLPPRKRLYTDIHRPSSAEPTNKRPNRSEEDLELFDGSHVEEALQNVNQMLDCILAMVDKTKKTLSLLQKRPDPLWNLRMPLELEIKRRVTPPTIPHFDIGLLDVRRRTEEAVQEVRRQAMLELEKAVTAAESRASQMIAMERTKLETMILEAKRQAQQEVLTRLNKHEPTTNDSMLNCWNCGRKANDTCSGCGLARYCGAFCQHRHWESHHKVCKALHLSREAPEALRLKEERAEEVP